MADLILPLKREFFDAIKNGSKSQEYRRANDYWQQRLEGHSFDRVILTLGYPARDDHSKRLTRAWRGYRKETITHPFFGPDPVEVYVIDVSKEE